MAEALTRVGRYEIINKLGRGGMGTLYLARDPAIERLVAIKLLREDFDNEELRERFAREARSAGKLRHPNVVTIFDVGEDAGRPFIAMEYIPGETLAEVIQRRQPLGLSRKVQLVEDMCAGLEYAHKAGIVHRDIKPANIMVDPEGVVKILDFGIARVAQSGMTQSGMLVGTLNYMSPEQVMGTTVDLRSDVFAVGAVLYELITYQQAFPGGIHDGIFNRIMSEQPAPAAGVVPGLPTDIERILAKSLEKDPGRRYQDLGQMRRDLLRARQTLDESMGVGEMTVPLKPVKGSRGPETGGAISATGGRRQTDRAELAKRRAAQIEGHLAKAHEDFDAGRFEDAIASCELAATLDPDDVRALDLMDRVRYAVEEQQMLEMVSEARGQLQRGAITAAGALLDRATAINPSAPADNRAVREIQQVRLEIERARERAELLRVGMERARAALDAGQFDAALRHATDLLAIDPSSPDAQRIRTQAQEGRDAQRRAQELEGRAAEAVVIARALFARGKHDEALQQLRAFTPAHALVAETLEQLAHEAAEIARRREEDERRRAAEADAARKREAERQRLAAEEEAARKREAERRAAEEEAARKREAERQRLAAEEQAAREREAERRRLAEEDAARKQAAEAARQQEAARAREQAQAAQRAAQLAAALESQLAVARQRFTAGKLNDAREIAAAILRQDPQHQGARALEANIAAAEKAAADGETWRPDAPMPLIAAPAPADARASEPATAPQLPPTIPVPTPSPVRPPRDSGERPAIMTPPPPRPREPEPKPTIPSVKDKDTGGRQPGLAIPIGLAAIVILAIGLAIKFWPGQVDDGPGPNPTTSIAEVTTSAPIGQTTIVTTSTTGPLTTTSTVTPTTAPTTSAFNAASLAAMRDARDAANTALTSAREANAPSLARATYDNAVAAFQDGDRLASSDPDNAARRYRQAADLFSKAAAEARMRVTTTTSTRVIDVQPPQTTSVPVVTTTSAQVATTSVTVTTSAVVPPAVNDDAAIRDTLRRYQAAYESLNPAAVKAVVPGIDVRSLASVFKEYVSLSERVDVERIDIAPDGQSATARATVTTAPVVKTGRAQPTKRTAEFRLKKQNNTWVIDVIMMR